LTYGAALTTHPPALALVPSTSRAGTAWPLHTWVLAGDSAQPVFGWYSVAV